MRRADIRRTMHDIMPEEAKIQTKIKIHPMAANRKLTGISFDLLFRFMAESRGAVSGKWDFEERINRSPQYARKQLNGYLCDAKTYSHELKNDSVPSVDLARSCILLAKTSLLYRSRRRRRTPVFKIPKDMPEEIIAMSRIIPWEKFSGNVITAPTFGKAGHVVGGAVADILVNNILIDVKTTACPVVKESFVHQLYGYALLSSIGGIDQGNGQTIRKLGVYFARYGELHLMPAPDINSNAMQKLAVRAGLSQ